MTSPIMGTAASHTTERPFTILIVEDDAADAEQIIEAIEQAGLKTLAGEVDLQLRARAEGALKMLAERPVDLVITDLVMPSMDGLDLLSQIQAIDRDLPVLIVTRMKGIETAVQAMKRGAYDYLLKPVNAEDLGTRLHRAIRVSEILRYNSAFKRVAQQGVGETELVGDSATFRKVRDLVERAAEGRSTVLITGETGTGKGMIARAIHAQSREADQPYQTIDCATMPEGMVESELFGHVRGAFTGAIVDKPGLIELADGGTVFLDEISEMSLPLQAKLLRVLEENEVRRLGGTRVKRVQTRFIAASNQALEEKIADGSFRKDLYYRLAVVRIHVPPLREHGEDIPAIARYLCAQLGREMGKPRCYLDSSAITELTSYPWPGNVRELRNVIERAILLTTTPGPIGADIAGLLPYVKRATGLSKDLPYVKAKEQVLAEFTAAYLREKLAAYDGHLSKAAEASGLQRQYFSDLVKRYVGEAATNNRDG
jgi:DNA-binding NtrC family response regulator